MKINKLISVLAFLTMSSFLLVCYPAKAAVSPDAIAIRVMPNTDHYSPLLWYEKNVKLKGSPQNLIVDDYEAVRDGRTVYVNAANISGTNFYTNIYIISYNQEAENPTIDIFGQILTHWKFNTNINDNAQKQKIIRDVKRLADVQDIKIALENYNIKNGYYPKLTAGSYITGFSVSTWPSWQATLGKELAITMPLDPINKLGGCPGYDVITCWDQINKKFYFDLSNSKQPVYWYKDGTIYAGLETSYTIVSG